MSPESSHTTHDVPHASQNVMKMAMNIVFLCLIAATKSGVLSIPIEPRPHSAEQPTSQRDRSPKLAKAAVTSGKPTRVSPKLAKLS